MHPGANGTFDSRTGPREKKGVDFFPPTVFADPSSRFSPILRDFDDIAGSQGMLRQILIDVDTGEQVELCDPLPELNDVEMSCSGRNWPQLASRLLDRRPLASQWVRSGDSVLGCHVDGSGTGLSDTYREPIASALCPQWCSSRMTADGVPQINANLPLILGLAVPAYESMLGSDDSR